MTAKAETRIVSETAEASISTEELGEAETSLAKAVESTTKMTVATLTRSKKLKSVSQLTKSALNVCRTCLTTRLPQWLCNGTSSPSSVSNICESMEKNISDSTVDGRTGELLAVTMAEVSIAMVLSEYEGNEIDLRTLRRVEGSKGVSSSTVSLCTECVLGLLPVSLLDSLEGMSLLVSPEGVSLPTAINRESHYIIQNRLM